MTMPTQPDASPRPAGPREGREQEGRDDQGRDAHQSVRRVRVRSEKYDGSHFRSTNELW